jgi:hypothetical protein
MRYENELWRESFFESCIEISIFVGYLIDLLRIKQNYDTAQPSVAANKDKQQR